MGKIVINTVYNVYMYEHGLIHVPYRKATCIHHFYSILSLFEVCRLIFYMYYYSSCIDGHKRLLTDDREQSHLKSEPSVDVKIEVIPHYFIHEL